MKENKWIVWVILISSLFGIANNGVSLVAFILSIVILAKYSLISKKSINKTTTNKKEINNLIINEDRTSGVSRQKESNTVQNKMNVNSPDIEENKLNTKIDTNKNISTERASDPTKSSNLDVYDILTLHLNNKREVGKELTNHHLLIEKQIDVMSHIENLLRGNVLITKCDFNHSLNYLRVPELKSILKENGLKVSGNKPELIERIKENIKEEDVNLPQVYIATNKGEKLIKNTKYIHHFFHEPYIINLAVAHKLVKDNYNVNDKIEFIYLKLIENNRTEPHQLKRIIQSLTRYYKTIKKDKSIVRKYTNLNIYLGFVQSLDYFKFNIKHGFIEKNILGSFHIDIESLEYYEDLILVENINLNVLKKLFFTDVSSFITTNMDICSDFCEIIFAHVNKNTNISTDKLPAIRNYISKE